VPIDEPVRAYCSRRRQDVGNHRKRLAPITSIHRTGSVLRRKLKAECQNVMSRLGTTPSLHLGENSLSIQPGPVWRVIAGSPVGVSAP
jgi:hypothetical protein